MIHHGDCLEIMPTLPAESVDSIVTDPPYGLSFMGKNWDHGIPGEPFWREALRIAKPGTHLLAFGGTRTFHRLTCAIEDAGWEIRDCIMWVYGSGFPKSHDVSKAIDKLDASEAQNRRRLQFTAWVRSQGITSRQIDEATGTNMGGHYTTAASQPAIMTREHLEQCRHLFACVPEWVEREADQRTVESENFKRREVVGRSANGIAGGSGKHVGEDGAYGFCGEYDITAPATDAAKKWQGWGTALKPAWEPIIVARKPLAGTVAQNVQEYGTGAINVDGCRIGEFVNTTPSGVDRRNAKLAELGYRPGEYQMGEKTPNTPPGRWPANLIHDGSDEVTGLMGEAARFFYCAKASKADREKKNHHPTVKPTDLMRYLCRLVTQPDGIVFDPFCGSGSTGKAATLEGFRFIGIERESEYVEIANTRIAHACGDMPLLEALT